MTEQEIAERTAAWVAESLESYSIWLCERLSLLAFAAEEDPAAGALYAAVLDTFEGEIRSRQYERQQTNGARADDSDAADDPSAGVDRGQPSSDV